MNEHIQDGTELVNLLKNKHKFMIDAEEIINFKEYTCVKMRSAAQFQINKIGLMDQSTKDVIIGCSKVSE